MMQIVYISQATEEFRNNADANLDNILEVARKNNKELNVTGMLLYRNGLFLQILEGHPVDVFPLYGRIASDSRHTLMRTLFKQDVDERIFDFWSMGFSNIQDKDLDAIAGILPWQEIQTFFDANKEVPREKILSLFKSFKYQEAA